MFTETASRFDSLGRNLRAMGFIGAGFELTADWGRHVYSVFHKEIVTPVSINYGLIQVTRDNAGEMDMEKFVIEIANDGFYFIRKPNSDEEF